MNPTSDEVFNDVALAQDALAAQMQPGDIANAHGDLCFTPYQLGISEGLVLLPFAQAMKALPFGWHWLNVDGKSVTVQRGGTTWKSVRLEKEGGKP